MASHQSLKPAGWPVFDGLLSSGPGHRSAGGGDVNWDLFLCVVVPRFPWLLGLSSHFPRGRSEKDPLGDDLPVVIF